MHHLDYSAHQSLAANAVTPHYDVEVIDLGSCAVICALSTLAQAWLTLKHGSTWHQCEWRDVTALTRNVIDMGFTLRYSAAPHSR